MSVTPQSLYLINAMSCIIEYNFGIRTTNLSIDELKLIAESRKIKEYKNKSKNDSTKILSEPKPKIHLSKKKIKEIKKYFSELRYRFPKSKMNEFSFFII